MLTCAHSALHPSHRFHPDVRIPWAKLYYCHVEPSGLGAVVMLLVVWGVWEVWGMTGTRKERLTSVVAQSTIVSLTCDLYYRY